MKKACLAGLAVGVMMFGTAQMANAALIASDEQGWVNSIGTGNGGRNGNNTFTGNEFGYRYNSWARFDLSSAISPVSTASLQLQLARFPENAPETYTIDIYDVDTITYNDLMTGNLYGSVTGSNGTYIVTLNSHAIDDINANLGGEILFGFTNRTLNTENPVGVDLGIYVNGGARFGYPSAGPVLNTAPVPVPAAVWLLGAGLASLAGIRLRGKNQ